MSLEYLESIRSSELESLLSIASEMKPERKNLHILEIGAGAGWQAKKLAEVGYEVEAIDIEDSNFLENRIWPITNYDGKHIPFADDSFDIVFSSNVLGIIPHLREFQVEMQRVLKPEGVAVHIVSSGSWRFWTNLTHYPFVLRTLMNRIYERRGQVSQAKQCYAGKSKTRLLRRAIFPSAQDEKRSALGEIYRFSRPGWSSTFTGSGWEIKSVIPTRVFYTGYVTFGSRLSIRLRRCLSYVLGSASHVFVLTKGKAGMRNAQLSNPPQPMSRSAAAGRKAAHAFGKAYARGERDFARTRGEEELDLK